MCYYNWGERERAPSCGLNGRAVTMSPLLWTQRTCCHDIYIDRRASGPYVHRHCACAALRANIAGRIGNGFSPAESSFLCPNPMMMMIWDYKRERDELFWHLQGSKRPVLTPREATESPRQRSRFPLSLTEAT